MSNINYEIKGNEMQLLEVSLKPKQTIMSEAGAMLYMLSPDIEMKAEMKGGLLGGLKRIVSKETLMNSVFVNKGQKENKVAFASPYPGTIIPINLSEVGGKFICQKDVYLASEENVDISVELTKKIGAGFFGGEGFILQKLTSKNGMVFIHAGGHVEKIEIEAGETIKVDTGCLVGFSGNIDYDIEFVGNVKTAIFGGEGLFLTKLTGPGTVYLQSLPISELLSFIYSRMPRQN